MDFKPFNHAKLTDRVETENNFTTKVMNEKKTNGFSFNPQSQNKTDTPNWSDYKVLIAEDEDTNFIYLQTALEKTNIQIIRAKNGREAVEFIRINPYINVILMDIKMPEMNGLEATRSIKSFRKDVPIIVQTAFAMEEDRRNCIAIGCDDFLAKPIRYKILIDSLRKFLK